MKYSYKCSECKKVNIVDGPDMFTMGMGRDGASAMEFDLGAMMGSGSFGGGFRGPTGGRVPREILVKCIHCDAKNIIKLTP